MTKNKNLYQYCCLTFAIAVTLCYGPSIQAEEKPIDYTQLESIGLYDANHENSLGHGLYHPSERSSLTYFLKNFRPSRWAALDHTLKNLLLTAADTGAVRNDIPVKNGEDLFTLRLGALLKLGYNKQAYKFFTKMPQNSAQEKTLRLGIISMLLNKEKALACLEVKTHFPKHHNIAFWRELNAYCSLSLSKDPNPAFMAEIKNSAILSSLITKPKFTIEYKDGSLFKTLTPVEKAILIAEDAVIPVNEDLPAYINIPPQDISALLTQSRLNDRVHITLYALAIKHNILETNDLENLYRELADKYKKDEKTPAGIRSLPTLYKKLQGVLLPSKRNEKLNTALTIAETTNDFTLIPLLPAFSKMDIGKDISLENVKRILPLYLHSTAPVPEDWLEDLSKQETTSKKEAGQVLTALILMSESVDKKILDSSQKIINAYLLSSSYTTPIKNIIENIDSSLKYGDKDYIIYENDFDLATNKSYTMPPTILTDELSSSSTNQNIAKTLLLSGFILGGIEKEKLYSGTLGDVVIALSKTGYKNVAQRTLAQAILEQQN